MDEKLNVSNRLDIKQKKDKFYIKGETDIPQLTSGEGDIQFNGKYKNYIVSFRYKPVKKNLYPQEISYFIRYIDPANYSFFTLSEGKYIRFSNKRNNITTLDTGNIKITEDNLFKDKFDMVLSVFEESFIAIIDKTMVMNIEHLVEDTGDFFFTFTPSKENDMEFELENFGSSDSILNFEAVIQMQKNPSVYFMEANIFYEQSVYEYALYYYKKGLLYGNGDEKIYNRVGNLQFLIENYPSAEFYYKLAYDITPDNREYKVNFVRSLIKQNKSTAFLPLIEEFKNSNDYDIELFIDYAGFLINGKNYTEAKTILDKIKDVSFDNPGFKTKYGRVLIESGKIDEGKNILFEAATIMKKTDPSSAAIILKYSLEKKIDLDSIKLLVDILFFANEYKTIFDILNNIKDEITFDDCILEKLIISEVKLGMYQSAWNELEKIDGNTISSDILIYKVISATELKKYDKSREIIEVLYQNEEFKKKNINLLVREIFKLAGASKMLPENVDTLIGECDKQKDDYQEAVREYGKLLVDNGEYKKALPIIERFLDKNPEDVEMQFNAGIVYDGLEDYESARKYLTKVSAVSNDPLVIYTLSHTLYYGKYFQDALNLLLTNYARLENDGKIDNLIGNIYLSLDNIAEAQRYYYIALEKDNDNEEYALNLAESFYKMKDYESAFKITSQIIKKGEFDRAMTLHIKIKEHLYISVKCSLCGTNWDIVKKTFEEDGKIEIYNNTGCKIYPAGICSHCGKIYCNKCASLIDNKYICPEDGAILTGYHSSKNIVLEEIDDY